MQHTCSLIRKIFCAAAVLLAAAALNCASAAATPNCSNSPLSSEFWTDAQQNLASQPVAKLTSVDGTPAGLSIELVSASAPATDPTYAKYAAFYLPPYLLTDVALADKLFKLEKNPSETEPTPLLPTSPGAILLIPTAPNNCRFILLVPTGSESAFPDASARRTVGADAIPRLVDDLYRRMFPNAPSSKNIVNQGIADPIYKWRFAQAMLKPFTVLVPSDVISHPPATSVVQTSITPTNPDYTLWQMAIGRFAWPDSLRSLDIQTHRVWPLLIQINLRSNEKRSPDAIKNDLAALHNMLVQIKPLGDLAKNDFASLGKLDVSSLDPLAMAQYGAHLATLERVIGNDYDLLVSNATAQYEALYARSVGSPPVSTMEPFDRESLLKYRSKQHQDALSLAPLTTSNLDQLVPSKSDQIPKGNAYIVFKDVRDPLTQSDLIQTEIVLALSTESLLNAASSALSTKIPAESCEIKISHGPLVSSTNNGSLLVSADAHLRVRVCLPHPWVCFKGWVPHWCTNTIKTDLFEIDDKAFAILSTAPGEQAIATSTIINVPFQTTQQITKLIPFKSIDNVGDIKNRFTLKKAYFTKRAGTNEILWILVADMEPVDLTGALTFREILKATLTLKDEPK